MKKYQLYLGSLFFVVAIVVTVFISVTMSFFVGIILCILFGFAIGFGKTKSVSFLMFCIALGFLRIVVFSYFEIDTQLDSLVNKKTSETYFVNSLPLVSGSKMSATIISKKTKSKISFDTSAYKFLSYGDLIDVTGKLQKASGTSLIKNKVFYKLSSKDIKVVSHENGNKFIALLFSFRNFFHEKIYSVFPSPQGELAVGLTTEGADSISKELKAKFRQTGLSHIVALSGTNVSIIVQTVTILLARAKRNIRFPIIFLFIIAFAIMTGLTSTVIRASIMAIISVAADILRRKYNAARALFLSLFIMTLWNPYTPLYDVSFQLSFIATLSMLVVVPPLEVILARFIRHETLRETLSTTLSAEILVTPVILFYSGMFSVVAPLCNILVVPFVPFGMLFGFLPFVFSFSDILSRITSVPGRLLLSYIFIVVDYFSSLPFASFEIKISLLSLVVVYAGIAALLWYTYKKLNMKLEL